MKNKRWLRSVAFILVLCIAVVGVMQCYTLPKNHNSRVLNSFEALPDNVLDGVVIGSSVIAHGWVSAVAMERHGLALWNIGTSIQAFGAIPGYIEYAMKNHDIKYVVIDVHSLRKQLLLTTVYPSKIKVTNQNVPDLEARFKMLDYIFGYAERMYDFYGYPKNEDNILRRDDLSLYLPIVGFHNRWVEGLKKADFVDVENPYLAANDLENTAFKVWDMTDRVKNLDFDGTVEIDDFQKNELDLLFSFIEEKGLKAIFINTPSFKDIELQQDLSSIIAYCAEKGYDTIDFSTREMLEKAGFDPAMDFCDEGHVNLLGAEKLTDYICRYVIDNGYYSEDRRGQAGYEFWEEGSKKYRDYFIKGWKNKGIDVETDV